MAVWCFSSRAFTSVFSWAFSVVIASSCDVIWPIPVSFLEIWSSCSLTFWLSFSAAARDSFSSLFSTAALPMSLLYICSEAEIFTSYSSLVSLISATKQAFSAIILPIIRCASEMWESFVLTLEENSDILLWSDSICDSSSRFPISNFSFSCTSGDSCFSKDAFSWSRDSCSSDKFSCIRFASASFPSHSRSIRPNLFFQSRSEEESFSSSFFCSASSSWTLVSCWWEIESFCTSWTSSKRFWSCRVATSDWSFETSAEIAPFCDRSLAFSTFIFWKSASSFASEVSESSRASDSFVLSCSAAANVSFDFCTKTMNCSCATSCCLVGRDDTSRLVDFRPFRSAASSIWTSDKLTESLAWIWWVDWFSFHWASSESISCWADTNFSFSCDRSSLNIITSRSVCCSLVSRNFIAFSCLKTTALWSLVDSPTWLSRFKFCSLNCLIVERKFSFVLRASSTADCNFCFSSKRCFLSLISCSISASRARFSCSTSL